MTTLNKILIIIFSTISSLACFSQNPTDTLKVNDTTNSLISDIPDMTLTIYPENDGITYNQFVGETIAGFVFARGWRKDTINGGFNKEVYVNPFTCGLENNRFQKQSHDGDCDYFYYAVGKKFTGEIHDTLTSYYTGEKIVFKATCINGKLQGQGTLTTMKKNKLIAKCYFENGEIIGECVSWDLATLEETRVTYVKGSYHWTKYTVLDKDGKVIETREK